MQTGVQTVPKLEFIPVPPSATVPCLAPMPPLTSEGVTRYEDLPAYLVEVLGVLEECNRQMETIRYLMAAPPRE